MGPVHLLSFLIAVFQGEGQNARGLLHLLLCDVHLSCGASKDHNPWVRCFLFFFQAHPLPSSFIFCLDTFLNIACHYLNIFGFLVTTIVEPFLQLDCQSGHLFRGGYCGLHPFGRGFDREVHLCAKKDVQIRCFDHG